MKNCISIAAFLLLGFIPMAQSNKPANKVPAKPKPVSTNVRRKPYIQSAETPQAGQKAIAPQNRPVVQKKSAK